MSQSSRWPFRSTGRFRRGWMPSARRGPMLKILPAQVRSTERAGSGVGPRSARRSSCSAGGAFSGSSSASCGGGPKRPLVSVAPCLRRHPCVSPPPPRSNSRLPASHGRFGLSLDESRMSRSRSGMSLARSWMSPTRSEGHGAGQGYPTVRALVAFLPPLSGLGVGGMLGFRRARALGYGLSSRWDFVETGRDGRRGAGRHIPDGRGGAGPLRGRAPDMPRGLVQRRRRRRASR